MEATGKLSKEGLSPKEFTATKEHATLGGTFYGSLAHINAGESPTFDAIP